METIFDHNITLEEQKQIIAFETKAEYLANTYQGSAYAAIEMLYRIRGDYAKAERYAALSNQEPMFMDNCHPDNDLRRLI